MDHSTRFVALHADCEARGNRFRLWLVSVFFFFNGKSLPEVALRTSDNQNSQVRRVTGLSPGYLSHGGHGAQALNGGVQAWVVRLCVRKQRDRGGLTASQVTPAVFLARSCIDSSWARGNVLTTVLPGTAEKGGRWLRVLVARRRLLWESRRRPWLVWAVVPLSDIPPTPTNLPGQILNWSNVFQTWQFSNV